MSSEKPGADPAAVEEVCKRLEAASTRAHRATHLISGPTPWPHNEWFACSYPDCSADRLAIEKVRKP